MLDLQTNIVNIEKYASDLQTFLAVKQIEKDVEAQDTCLQSLVNSDRLNQVKLAYKIDTDLKNNSTPPVLIKLTVLVLLQDNTILPPGSKEHPMIPLPVVFIFWR
jgi:hypothetical protein